MFATAYNDHTLRAFELAALDYVLKPFDERRLAKTMERVRHALDERSMIAEQQTVLRNYLRQAAPASSLTKLWGERENQSRVLVDYRDILWVVAEMKDVFVQTSRGEKLRIRNTLKDLEPRLIPHNFARVHKGYLVNLDHIADVATWFSGSYVIHMTDAERTQIPMSRRYAAQLKKLTDWH